MKDSRSETIEHINKVAGFLIEIAQELLQRAKFHDQSKLEEPEKSVLDNCPYDLSTIVYGSEEYLRRKEYLKPAIEHHHKHNRHHTEYFGKNGVNGMTLIDLIEMYCDWKAVTMRTKNADFESALQRNFKTYEFSEQLSQIFYNTFCNE